MAITLEAVDQVINRTNCTYKEAKDALEKTDGDALEAIILIEEAAKAAGTQEAAPEEEDIPIIDGIPADDEIPDPVEAAVNMIHAEYMHTITVQNIADRVCLDRTYFSNLFRQRIGISPKQYLLKHRMEQAMFFLQDGYSITVTAASVGYQDIYTFSKMFKRYFGNPPSNYRRT